MRMNCLCDVSICLNPAHISNHNPHYHSRFKLPDTHHRPALLAHILFVFQFINITIYDTSAADAIIYLENTFNYFIVNRQLTITYYWQKISQSHCEQWRSLPSHLKMPTITADDVDRETSHYEEEVMPPIKSLFMSYHHQM